MQEALAEARRAWGLTHPNPAVGAVIVHEGRVVARGCTQPPPGRHAEIVALEAFSALGLRPAADTTLVVTLEPCSTHGRTPPCTDAIAQAGIRRIVIGALDPNPQHAGRGIQILREAGLEVDVGILERDCSDLNLIFNHWIVQQRPLLAAKVAATLDGKVATRSGESRWITGEAARADVMRWRGYFPAIAVGAGTVLADNPRLTARLGYGQERCPWRLVFDRRLRSGGSSGVLVYSDAYAHRTILITDLPHAAAAAALAEARGLGGYWALDFRASAEIGPRLYELMSARGITGLYVEGGPRVHADLFSRNLYDYLFWYQAPLLMGDSSAAAAVTGLTIPHLDNAFRLRELRREFLGDDLLIRGFLR